MFCVNCQKEVEAQIVTGADIYGPRVFCRDEPFAMCPHCGNYGEYAINKEPPFSVIPTFELRKAYNHIDCHLSSLWERQIMTKAEAENLMSVRLYGGLHPYRTHEIRTRDEAVKAYHLAKQLYKEFITDVKNS
ncbi:MAG: hypothetical protein IJ545_07060 [Alphaproteobacteria bacterium]|nr:hypothetical protein [Alphaproteobacteria bacterium]